MPLLFEWDPRKARSNLAKHGVNFDEAGAVFRDPFSITIDDPLHSEDEERSVLIGCSHKQRILVIVHTEREGRIRLITARRATRKERLFYEKNAQRS